MVDSLGERELAARRVLWLFAVLVVVALAVVFIALRPGSLGAEGPVVTATPPAPATSVPTAVPPRAAEPTSSAPVTPAEPAPGNWQLPDRQWEPYPTPSVMEPPLAALAGNVFYRFPVAELEGCPAPAVASDALAWREAVTAHWSCLHAAFVPVFEQMHARTAPAEVHFFEGAGADSPCGWIEAPAFYCSAGDGSVHFGSEHLRMALEWDLAVTEMVGHEYGHHIQNVYGVLAESQKDPTGPASGAVRVELMADCFAGMWMKAATRTTDAQGQALLTDISEDDVRNAMGAAKAVGDDEIQKKSGGGVDPEGWTHGSAKARQAWLLRGMGAESVSRCDTFAVQDPHAV